MHHPQTARFNWFTVYMCSKTTPAHRLAVMTTHTHLSALHISAFSGYTHTQTCMQKSYRTTALCRNVWTHMNSSGQRFIPQTCKDWPSKAVTSPDLVASRTSFRVENGRGSSANVHGELKCVCCLFFSFKFCGLKRSCGLEAAYLVINHLSCYPACVKSSVSEESVSSSFSCFPVLCQPVL